MKVTRHVGKGVYVTSSLGEAIAVEAISESVGFLLRIPGLFKFLLVCVVWFALFGLGMYLLSVTGLAHTLDPEIFILLLLLFPTFPAFLLILYFCGFWK